MEKKVGKYSNLFVSLAFYKVLYYCGLINVSFGIIIEAENMNNLLKKKKKDVEVLLLELNIEKDEYQFSSDIKTAIKTTELELKKITLELRENINALQSVTPECDKTDYILGACSGMICAIMDIFLIGKPGESVIGDVTDKWFEQRTMDFARMCGWNNKKNGTLSSAIKYLEKKFKIPYDQRGAGDAASWVFDLNPKNHHFKSLGHNPTILGLFFSILDQFRNTSHFVSGGELISLQEADGKFELRGRNMPSKLFSGFVNWLGHLISDVSGSSSSRGRGMGIPSPFWSWTNDVIAIKRKLNIPIYDFDKSLNELAIEIYKQGYDVRFQSAQVIPVFVNELLVRTIYSTRRLVKYFITVSKDDRSFSRLWKSCEPFSDASVKRMLTVAHGTFCIIDISDAISRGVITGVGNFNVAEFFLRLNIVGIGRFTISLYGEVRRGFKRRILKEEEVLLRRKKVIMSDYLDGLKYLSEIYNDKSLLSFVEEFKENDMYKQAFDKSRLLADKRGVDLDEKLKNKADIDLYFTGGKA